MNNKIKIILFFLILAGLCSPLSLSAAGPFDYVPMENIPGFEGQATDFYQYISSVYKFGIWAIGIAALLMISIGGYMYITSAGNNSSMEKAKGVITDAVIGLILALGAYLLLYVINPDLVKISKLKPVSAPLTAPVAPTPPVTAPGAVSCSSINNQKPAQCADASPDLNNLLSCVYQKLPGKIQISSISDGNGGVNCYKDHPTWTQCPKSGGSNCCYHAKTSCHYGGRNCSDGSHAVDFSDNGSSASNTEIKNAIIACGGKALDEGNHVHGSIGNCGCDTNL